MLSLQPPASHLLSSKVQSQNIWGEISHILVAWKLQPQ